MNQEPGPEEKRRISPLRYALSKNISTRGPLNCRSLGFARDDKGESGASMESSCRIEAVFHDLGWAGFEKHLASYLRVQKTRKDRKNHRLLGMTKGRVALSWRAVAEWKPLFISLTSSVEKHFHERPVGNLLPATNQWVPHISLVLREMWDAGKFE
jgi:hypothetical protein